MRTIDGSDGGGQLLRTALSLSVVTDTPFRIEDVRGDRPNPGLRPQHRAAVALCADLCDADVEGATPGSETVTFEPGRIDRTELDFAVGTAGSVTLLFDTLLPVAAVHDGPIELTATGGTDVKWSPPIAYLRRVKLPLLARYGLDAAVDLERTGFYPAGGGEATLQLGASTLSPLALERRGDLEHVEVHSKASESLAEQEVADRQADHAAERLTAAGVPVAEPSVDYVPTDSPGSSLLLRGVYERSLVGADALGERGRTSETVADRAVDAFLTAHERGVPVDRHMADQLVALLALVGGRVRIPKVTDHVRSNLALVGEFGSDARLERADGALTLVASPHPAVSDG